MKVWLNVGEISFLKDHPESERRSLRYAPIEIFFGGKKLGSFLSIRKIV